MTMGICALITLAVFVGILIAASPASIGTGVQEMLLLTSIGIYIFLWFLIGPHIEKRLR
ncbi:MAG TPA: hypothetical protein VI893_03730 [Thermoplasmata archaeon]|nr:hypothetical protein [Thermoplasmata archaeon]